MRYSRVALAAIGYELAPHVVSTAELEARIAPVYAALGIPGGQVEALTGIRERRLWEPGQDMATPAARAAGEALASAGVSAAEIGSVVYAGVNRDNLEPATACAVADALGVAPECDVHDISNACLGVMTGIVNAADAIESGRIGVALVVSAESCRDIVDSTIARLLARPGDMDLFRKSIATLTGGSGAVAAVVVRADHPAARHRMVAAVHRTAPRHHRLCRWGGEHGILGVAPQVMETDAPEVLRHGVALGVDTYRALLAEAGWPADPPPKTICHQVGSAHRTTILKAFGVPPENDFTTFEHLGNIGTVSLPMTAAIADERGAIAAGDRVVFSGIGSGLNCLSLAFQW